MKSLSRYAAALIVALTFVWAPALEAQATRTWISGVGDDANPCSRTAPCRTWAGAIAKTAAGGEISVLDPGSFGSIILTKSITLNAVGVVAIIGPAPGADGININITSSTDSGKVRIRGLWLTGSGTASAGIRIVSAKEVTIEDSVIDDFGSGIRSPVTASVQIFVQRTIISNNSQVGIGASGTGTVAAISDVLLFDNGVALSGNVVSFGNNAIYANTSPGITPTKLPLQ